MGGTGHDRPGRSRGVVSSAHSTCFCTKVPNRVKHICCRTPSGPLSFWSCHILHAETTRSPTYKRLDLPQPETGAMALRMNTRLDHVPKPGVRGVSM